MVRVRKLTLNWNIIGNSPRMVVAVVRNTGRMRTAAVRTEASTGCMPRFSMIW